MPETLTYSATLVIIECYKCAMPFGVPKDFDRRNHEQGGTFYCPSGHGQVYSTSEVDKLKKQLADAEQTRRWLDGRLTHEGDQRRAAERSAAAYKGQATRLRKRTAAGVCPVPECHRHFENLARHMHSKHPDFAADA